MIVANSIKHGTRFGLITVAGTTLGVAIQVLLVVFGLSAILLFAASALAWIKWAGVLYLIYLGVVAWRTPAQDLMAIKAQNGHAHKLFYQGLGFAIINPKTLLFNAAFLPQFLPSQNPTGLEVFIVAGVFLLVLGLGDVLWALFAGFSRSYIMKFNHLSNRVSGGFMILAGIGLAFAKDDSNAR